MLPNLVTRRNRILKGYAAFTDGEWEKLRDLLCKDVVWHTMPDKNGVSQEIRGRDGPYVPGPNPTGVVAYLEQLRNTNDVDLLGMAILDNVAITVDFTQSTDEEGPHGCADRIVFDDSGCIKEVWHCDAATHDHGHAAHSAT